MKRSALAKYLLNISAFIVLVFFIILSLRRPLIPWDSWAYHFPFSAKIFNINNYSNVFILDKYLEDRYDGFPLFAELLQGFLWLITDNISTTTLINSFALVIFILCAVRYTRANFPIMVYGILAFPLISIHATSSYIDLFVAIVLSMQYLLAVIIIENLRIKYEFGANLKKALFIYAITCLIIGNTKLLTALTSLSITAFLILSVIINKNRLVAKKFVYTFVGALMLSAVLTSSTMIKNAAIYKNPVYPFSVNMPVFNVTLNGPEVEYKNYPGYAEQYGIFSRPIYFMLSISEIDWILRQVSPSYTSETGNGDFPKKYLPARTGGLWSGCVLMSLLLLLFLNIYSFLLNRELLNSLSLFCFVTVFTAFLPQSHELRYYLYWPILLILNIACAARNLFNSSNVATFFGYFYMCLFLYSIFVLRGETMSSLFEYKNQRELIGISSDSEEVIAAKKSGGICLGPSYQPNQFKYSSVFQGEQYIIEQGWLKCVRYPEYTK